MLAISFCFPIRNNVMQRWSTYTDNWALICECWSRMFNIVQHQLCTYPFHLKVFNCFSFVNLNQGKNNLGAEVNCTTFPVEYIAGSQVCATDWCFQIFKLKLVLTFGKFWLLFEFIWQALSHCSTELLACSDFFWEELLCRLYSKKNRDLKLFLTPGGKQLQALV